MRLTLDRDEYRNALSGEIIAGLSSALRTAREDDGVHVVLLRAEGKAFCAGAKLDVVATRSDGMLQRKYHRSARELFTALVQFPKPTIACVQGPALAGGAGVATACDFVICAEEVVLGYPEVNLAMAPSMVMQILLRRVPWRIGMDWVFTGERIPAAEAARWGLVSQVVAAADLDRVGDQLASSLADRDLGALELIKELGLVGQDLPFERSLRYASEISALAGSSSAAREAISTFFDGRETDRSRPAAADA